MLGSRSEICVSIPRRRGTMIGISTLVLPGLGSLSGIEPVPKLVPPGSMVGWHSP